MTSSEPIRLRKRLLKDGRQTLYLDLYHNGKREYEYLKLYLIPEKSRADKETNKKTMQLAEAVRAKRIVDYQNGKFGFHQPEHNVKFFDYYSAMCEKRKGAPESRGNWGNWYSCFKHLQIYEKNQDITFEDITPEWVQGFKDYLENEATAWAPRYERKLEYHPLSRNSRLSYFNKLRACLNQALADGVIEKNPMRGIENFKEEESKRMYLTIDEVKAITKTECSSPGVKRAFLFSCLTGLRRSDIMKMTWSEVHKQGDYTRIIFKQKKTSGQEYIDITPQAAELLGERREPTDKVFYDFLTASATNHAIKEWMLRAGITKDITFHCARHTFAVMMLDIGTDIYTVSKLLGHRELSTTQIYARVLDKTKQAAVMNIPDIGLEKGE
ncbi:MAG: site-specific integrase [Prevotella sp.]|nr:site-specific integrase [Prevotella sp.]MBR3479232.1 site-specific integrase [Prevotella sp.]